MPLGGLALQDLSGHSVRKAQKIARDSLRKAQAQLEGLQGRTFYAVGGTWRALAKLHQVAQGYPLHIMHGYRLEAGEALAFLEALGRDATAVRALDSISEARRPLLAYGAVVLEEIVRLGRPRDVAISALGVREGLLYEELDAATRATDPLIAAASELNEDRSRSPRHGEELAAWTDRLIAALDPGESADERRLRRAACLLADIGWRAHPDYRGEQSLNLIAHAAFVGIDHPGRAFLALAIYFRHEGPAPEKASPALRALAGPRLFERARLLGAMMRVAYPVSVATAGVLPRTPLTVEGEGGAGGPDGGGAITLRLPRDMAALASERLLNRVRQLGRVAGREGRVEVG